MATFIIILFICGIAYALYQSTEGNSTPMSNLIDCPSCGIGVSRFSEKCLSCGHPIRPKRESGCLTVIGVLFVICGFFAWPFWILACLIFILTAVSKS